MKKIGFLTGLCLSAAALYGQDQYSYGGFDAPASVIQYGGYFYLSSTGKGADMSARDGDGYISRMKSDGSEENVTLKHIAGLDNPRGILALQGVLYVCDMGRLLGFDLKSRRKVFELSFSGEKTIQLTDIVSVTDNIVYVSATDIHTIFEVDLAAKKYRKWMETTAPTGLLIEDGQMYVCSWGTDSLPNGKLGAIDMKKKEYTPVAGDKGYLWGLAIHGSKLYFSDWVQPGKRGVIKWVDLATKETGRINLTSRVGGPADFMYDARNNIFFIPAMLEGVVYGAIGFK
jgi:hypothetical protein